MTSMRAMPHQRPRGQVATHHRTQSRSAVTLPEPCLWAGGRFAAFCVVQRQVPGLDGQEAGRAGA